MTNDLGDTIRQAREARKLSLGDVSARTKIGAHFLADIEHEAFDRLPAGVFRRAYLRTYADALGLNADDLVHTYVDRWEPPPPPEPEPRLSSWSDTQLRALRGVLVAVGVLAAIPLFSAFWSATAGGSNATSRVQASAASPSTPASAAIAPQAQPLRVEIRAIGLCWISATADEQSAVRRLVHPGESVSIDADSAIVLRLGDAGAVAYTINGVRGRTLGQRGEPVTVRITTKTSILYAAGAA